MDTTDRRHWRVTLRRYENGREKTVTRDYHNKHPAQARIAAMNLQGAIEVIEVKDMRTGKKVTPRRATL